MEGHGDGKPREKGGKPIGMRQRERCVESCHRRAWKARRPFQGEAKGKEGRERPSQALDNGIFLHAMERAEGTWKCRVLPRR